jgi:hypothetical protein
MRVVPAILLLAACAACSTQLEASTPASAGGSSAPQPTSSPTPRPTAPTELQGLWQATISTGQEVTLELRPTGFIVNREGAIGRGAIAVDGDRIVFTSHCELGPGAYQWSIQGGTLVFVPLDPPDPCGNRLIFLEGAEYTRVE